MPAIAAVPLPLSTKVTPAGSAPVLVMYGSGKPVAVTVKLPGAPTLKVAALPLVIAGDSRTVKVKPCCAGDPIPFDAVIVSA